MNSQTSARVEPSGVESLRDVRAARGLTLAEVGALAGIDAATVSRIERRRAKPKPDTVVKLARALGIGVDRVLCLVVTDDDREVMA